MILRHVVLTCSYEKNSDRLFKNLLGLQKSEPKIIVLDISKAMFNVDSELPIINYPSEHAHFEIFTTDHSMNHLRRVGHVCLEVGDLEAFLKKCRDLEVDVSQIPKGGRTPTFIRDYDDNLFEIKHKQPKE